MRSNKPLLVLEVLIVILIGQTIMVNGTFNYSYGEGSRRVTEVSQTISSISSEWSTTKVLSLESTTDSFRPEIIADKEGNIYVVWYDGMDYDGAGGDWDIFYKKYTARTETWSNPILVSTESTSSSWYPDVALDLEGNLHFVWSDGTEYNHGGDDNDIFYKKYIAITDTWTPTEVVSTESTESSYSPKIVLDLNENIYVVWEDYTDYDGAGGDRDIFYKKYNDATGTWTTTDLISTESTKFSSNLAITLDLKGDLHVVWEDATDYDGAGTDYDIFYRELLTEIDAWAATEVISKESTISSRSPNIASDSEGNLHVVWYDGMDYDGAGGDWDIFYKLWNVTGDGEWTSADLISSESTSNSQSPSIAINSFGDIYIVWYDWTDYASSGTDYDIFYRHFNTTMKEWTSTLVISTESSSNSYSPVITVDTSEQAHIAWEDTMDYNGAGTDSDIFYKRLSSPLGSAPILAPIFPTPSTDGKVFLQWSDIFGASNYFVYRDNATITTLNSLSSIAKVYNPFFVDTLNTSGVYYYAIVAGNPLVNSSISNCEAIRVDLSSENGKLFNFIPEETIIPLLFGSTILFSALCLVLLLKRR